MNDGTDDVVVDMGMNLLGRRGVSEVLIPPDARKLLAATIRARVAYSPLFLPVSTKRHGRSSARRRDTLSA